VKDDHVIERALERLRDAEPAAGFERRLLVSLRDAAESSSTAKRLPLLVSWRWRVSFALLVLVAAGVSLGALFLVRQHRLEGPPTLRLEEPVANLGEAASPLSSAASPARPRGHGARRHSATELTAAIHSQVSNLPAPPMPLTEQEKLLQRVVRRRDTGNVALLNSATQHTASARATQQFQRFFAMTPEEVRNQFE
jgi:hypothetical protein